MSSIKLVLRTQKKKSDGTAPLAIRITKDRKTRFIFTGKYILEQDWNDQICRVRKSHPNSTWLNNFLLKKLSEAHDTTIELELKDENTTAKDIKRSIKRSGSSVSFYDLAEERIAIKAKEGVFSVSRAEQSILNNIRRFHGDGDLHFTEISQSFLNKFKAFCTHRLGHSKRTITNQLIFIRTVYNLAIGDKIVDAKHYPFAGDKEKIRLTSGHKIGLTREEIERIENLDLKSGTSVWHTRNVWLLAYYFAGIRISDVIHLDWSEFRDGRLYYVMNKNEKPLSLKIPDKAMHILDYYRPKGKVKGYVFPYLKKADPKNPEDLFVKTRNAARLFNKYLKRIAEKCEISKNLSNHIARHSFGNIAGDKINPLMLQKLYRHTDLKTTINYQSNFIHKDADDALDAVLNS